MADLAGRGRLRHCLCGVLPRQRLPGFRPKENLMSLCWSILFLFAAAFSLSTWLEPRFQAWAGTRAKSSDILSVALGDSRRLFAKHFYVKADAYFHSGYYPTIFDNHPASGPMHMTAAAGAGLQDHEEGTDFLGQPKDWLDAFSRHFFPSRHRHLGEGADPDHHHEGGDGQPDDDHK